MTLGARFFFFWRRNAAAAGPIDRAGVVAFSFTSRNARADLTDADGIVSVQRAVFTAPNGNQLIDDTVEERTNAAGVWRANVGSRQAGRWTVRFEYTDSLGAGKVAQGSADR